MRALSGSQLPHGSTAVIRAVAEVSRAAARGGDDWSQDAQIDAMLLDESGNTVANGRASIAPGTFVDQLTLAPRAPLEAPASQDGDLSARLLDRVGKALPIPIATAIREDVVGSRWRRIEIVLAPLAHSAISLALARLRSS